MKTRAQLESTAALAKMAEDEAYDAMDMAEGALWNAQNDWADAQLVTHEAQRAVDEWKEPVEPVEPIVPIIPFV